VVWSVDAWTLPIFFGAGLAFLMAAAQWVRKEPGKANLLFSLVFLCCFVIILGAGVVANRLPPRYPFTIYLFFTAICLVGPSYYFYFNALLHPERTFQARSLLHFVPALVAFVLENGLQLMPLTFKQQWLSEMFTSPPQHVLILLVIAAALHSFSYLAYLLRMDLGLVWNVQEVKAELHLLVIVDVLAILSVVALFLGFTFQWPRLFVAGGNSLALLTVGVFLGYNRYPLFLETLRTEIEKKRYEKSSLTGVDTEVVHRRLLHLLQSEKIYRESELNLKGLADRVGLTPHQLSQYLNERMGADFRSFINAYRVAEAKELLTLDPDRNILSICYEVGFGSKSAFNAVFKKETAGPRGSSGTRSSRDGAVRRRDGAAAREMGFRFRVIRRGKT